MLLEQKKKCKDEEGKHNMCKAFEDFKEEGREDASDAALLKELYKEYDIS